jgi:hypothetical protein
MPDFPCPELASSPPHPSMLISERSYVVRLYKNKHASPPDVAATLVKGWKRTIMDRQAARYFSVNDGDEVDLWVLNATLGKIHPFKTVVRVSADFGPMVIFLSWVDVEKCFKTDENQASGVLTLTRRAGDCVDV